MAATSFLALPKWANMALGSDGKFHKTPSSHPTIPQPTPPSQFSVRNKFTPAFFPKSGVNLGVGSNRQPITIDDDDGEENSLFLPVTDAFVPVGTFDGLTDEDRFDLFGEDEDGEFVPGAEQVVWNNGPIAAKYDEEKAQQQDEQMEQALTSALGGYDASTPPSASAYSNDDLFKTSKQRALEARALEKLSKAARRERAPQTWRMGGLSAYDFFSKRNKEIRDAERAGLPNPYAHEIKSAGGVADRVVGVAGNSNVTRKLQPATAARLEGYAKDDEELALREAGKRVELAADEGIDLLAAPGSSEATSEVSEATSEIPEATSEIAEATSEIPEATSEVSEATSEVPPMLPVTPPTSRPEATVPPEPPKKTTPLLFDDESESESERGSDDEFVEDGRNVLSGAAESNVAAPSVNREQKGDKRPPGTAGTPVTPAKKAESIASQSPASTIVPIPLAPKKTTTPATAAASHFVGKRSPKSASTTPTKQLDSQKKGQDAKEKAVKETQELESKVVKVAMATSPKKTIKKVAPPIPGFSGPMTPSHPPAPSKLAPPVTTAATAPAMSEAAAPAMSAANEMMERQMIYAQFDEDEREKLSRVTEGMAFTKFKATADAMLTEAGERLQDTIDPVQRAAKKKKKAVAKGARAAAAKKIKGPPKTSGGNGTAVSAAGIAKGQKRARGDRDEIFDEALGEQSSAKKFREEYNVQLGGETVGSGDSIMPADRNGVFVTPGPETGANIASEHGSSTLRMSATASDEAPASTTAVILISDDENDVTNDNSNSIVPGLSTGVGIDDTSATSIAGQSTAARRGLARPVKKATGTKRGGKNTVVAGSGLDTTVNGEETSPPPTGTKKCGHDENEGGARAEGSVKPAKKRAKNN